MSNEVRLADQRSQIAPSRNVSDLGQGLKRSHSIGGSNGLIDEAILEKKMSPNVIEPKSKDLEKEAGKENEEPKEINNN